jgi:cytoskeletal protein RodZ
MPIGEILATARVEAGLTIEDVSRETRIRGGLIQAIEKDNFAPCGGDVYARGHIRNIAAIVGVDPRPLVAEFDRIHGGEPQPVENPAPTFDPHVAQQSERRRPNWAAAMAVALVVICVIAGFNLLSHHRSGSPASAQGSNPPPSPTASQQPVPQVPSPGPTGAVAILPQSGVHVRVRLVASRSWLHVTGSNGQVLFQGILNKGAQRDFADARRIRMTLGNAGAVDLIVNGKDLGVAGANGQVVNENYGPSSASGSGG